jgi:hypothetical protein
MPAVEVLVLEGLETEAAHLTIALRGNRGGEPHAQHGRRKQLSGDDHDPPPGHAGT